ncbi:MAG: hypothetical protein PHY47_00850 [Lachnospiraceae bacterium]|nr:hypothetical protein [Lachnospiraceae bacterium]
MTPENKIKTKDVIVSFLKEKYPSYPEIDPNIVIQNLQTIYKLIVDQGLIKKEEVPFDHFQHVVIDAFRSAAIMEQLNSFF